MKKVDAAISYFTNQGSRMNYAKFRAKNLPIGSGITEAACKTIIKQRFCRSGVKLKDKGASIVLSLRCLEKSNRWDQFWDKINQYGIPGLLLDNNIIMRLHSSKGVCRPIENPHLILID